MNTTITLKKATNGYTVETKHIVNNKVSMTEEIIVDKPSKAFDDFVKEYNVDLALDEQIINGNIDEINELLSEYF